MATINSLIIEINKDPIKSFELSSDLKQVKITLNHPVPKYYHNNPLLLHPTRRKIENLIKFNPNYMNFEILQEETTITSRRYSRLASFSNSKSEDLKLEDVVLSPANNLKNAGFINDEQMSSIFAFVQERMKQQ